MSARRDDHAAPSDLDAAERSAGSTLSAIGAYLDDRIESASSRAIAMDIAGRLLAAYARWATVPARLSVLEIERAEGSDAPLGPARQWLGALPLGLPADQRVQVSTALRAILAALDTHRTAAGDAPTTGEAGDRAGIQRARTERGRLTRRRARG